MEIFSPGKVNLALNVGPKQPDGYHRVDSIFHTIELGDIVTLELAETLSVTCSVDLGIAQEDNLMFKAARAFDAAFNTQSNVAIHVEKSLIAGGGLGGGSSNAAAVLYALALANNIGVHDKRLLEVAAQLGSDVPVFLAPTGASLMTRRGEHIEEALPAAAGVPIVIAWPVGAHSETGAVYQAFDEHPVARKSMDSLRDYLRLLPSAHNSANFTVAENLISTRAHILAGELYNNLSEAAIRVTPEVGDVLLFLLAQPQTLGATVSGSGACSFALCSTYDEAFELANQCQLQGWGARATRLRARGVSKINGVDSIHE